MSGIWNGDRRGVVVFGYDYVARRTLEQFLVDRCELFRIDVDQHPLYQDEVPRAFRREI